MTLAKRTTCRHAAALLLLAGASLLATGCHHNTQVAYQPPPPPTTAPAASGKYHPAHTSGSNAPEVAAGKPAPSTSLAEAKGKPVSTEVGLATWYGPNYNHRAGADGTIYNQDGMTAAHRTLPLGTVVRVTNLSTGEQVLVRITDRGPFAPGRVIDLSMGAAKALGIYRVGTAKVRLEAFAHPSADPVGKWCVQTGPFKTTQDALDLKAALIQRYRSARVTEFAGPTGSWVRIDPASHEKAQALAMQDWIGAPDAQSQAYLVRID
jgi:rare lipoprotein A